MLRAQPRSDRSLHPEQILREHVMVRVGGGWDTLEHYLDKHDPCRCTSLCESQRPHTPGLGRRAAGGEGPWRRSLPPGPLASEMLPGGDGPGLPLGTSLRLWWPLEVTADFGMEPDTHPLPPLIPTEPLRWAHRAAAAAPRRGMLDAGRGLGGLH